MKRQIKCRKAKFWIEDGVLFCEFKNEKDKKKFNEDCLDEYIEAISTLSNDRYLPLIIDLRKLKDSYAFSIVHVLAKNPKLKSAILTKSFVVNSYFLQFLILVLRRGYDPIIPNKIFTSFERAIEYSLDTNYIFNAQC